MPVTPTNVLFICSEQTRKIAALGGPEAILTAGDFGDTSGYPPVSV